MKIIKMLSVLFCTIVISNAIIAFDVDSVNDLEKLENLYNNLAQASRQSNPGQAMKDVITNTQNLGIAVTYIDATGPVGKWSRKIRAIIIKNNASINSAASAGLFGVSWMLPKKMSPYYKSTILRWFDGKK